MNPYDRELLIRVAPGFILAGIAAVSAAIQVREIKRQRVKSSLEHAARMKDLAEAGQERMERHIAWRASQPNIEEIIQMAREEVGSVEDIRRKMADPDHVWEL